MRTGILFAIAGFVVAAGTAASPAQTAGSPVIATSQTELREVAVGGFLGMGEHNVAVPVGGFKQEQGQIGLPGATKDTLKAASKVRVRQKVAAEHAAPTGSRVMAGPRSSCAVHSWPRLEELSEAQSAGGCS